VTLPTDTRTLDDPSASPHPLRWRLSRAGVLDVWRYVDAEFVLSDGRMILRGSNGSGKSRALEMLLPFLLDADRKRMDATGAGKVDLDELMRVGADGRTNRVGHLWIELSRPAGSLTIGAQIRHSSSAHRTDVWFFTTDRRIGVDLDLVDANRVPLSRDELAARIGTDRITRSPEEHRDRVRDLVFGLHGDSGRDRYTGLLQLLHTLRSPDVGNRIDEGRLPQILSDALPPLDDRVLAAAGDRLDTLGETRSAQEHLESALVRVRQFHAVYRRYAADLLRTTADEALRAADRVTTARTELDTAVGDATDLDAQVAAADTRLRERRDQLTELDRAIRGLESHALFRHADDLAQRAAAVDALGVAADQALYGARRARELEHLDVDRAVEHADELPAAVARAATSLDTTRRHLTSAGTGTGALPIEIRVDSERPDPHSEPVRTGRDDAPGPTVRPAPPRVTLVPADCDDLLRITEATAAEVRRRGDRAARRSVEARRLASVERDVHDAEADADRAGRDAEHAVLLRDSAARDVDAAASTFGHHWRRWITSDRTARLLPDLARDGAAVMRRLTDALDAVCEDTSSSEDSDVAAHELDAVLTDLVARARRTVHPHPEPVGDTTDADTASVDHTFAAARVALLDEQRRLDAAPDGPDLPGRSSGGTGVPLWQAVDFADTLGDDDRAGIEAALLAAGFLTATVDGEGRLRAQTGQILVSPRGEPPRQPLSTVLRPVVDAAVPQSAIAAVLSTIGFEDAAATASVSRDGRWHNGVLRGRHTVDTPEFIGAESRAAALSRRRVRLDEIAAELARLETMSAERAARRRTDMHREHELVDHLMSVPSSRALVAAVARHRAHRDHAALRTDTAAAARTRAADLRTRWADDLNTHRTACAHFGLPTGVDELDAVVAACTAADHACTALRRDLGSVAAARSRFVLATEHAEQAAGFRAEAEDEAESRWHRWHDRAAQVAAQSEAVDVDVAALADELRESEAARARTDEQCRRTLAHREELAKEVAEVLQRTAAARERLVARRDDLTAAATTLANRLSVPALVAAAAVQAEPPTRLDDPQQVAAVADTVLAALPATTGTDGNRVLTALQRFDRELSDRLDVTHTVDDGVHVVRVSGAGTDTTPTGVLAWLSEQAEQGRLLLARREHDAFAGFVLGGVADELHRRIGQAEKLIAAMNTSLADSRTSHGIGVRIGWRPVREDADAARITELLAGAGRLGGDGDDDLIEMLRRRVEESHDADPAAGYAEHLARALDYRSWHTVDVTILGPEPDQERRISKRAKISQGETRFVSYVTLFAAADGYLSGLPDTDRALRLVLLDDAFAKIDEPTIDELMGLLVRQDIDFVMTGHALWGCVPQVPALDIYEIRRTADGAAAATRVHWDGRARSVRPAAGTVPPGGVVTTAIPRHGRHGR